MPLFCCSTSFQLFSFPLDRIPAVPVLCDARALFIVSLLHFSPLIFHQMFQTGPLPWHCAVLVLSNCCVHLFAHHSIGFAYLTRWLISFPVGSTRCITKKKQGPINDEQWQFDLAYFGPKSSHHTPSEIDQVFIPFGNKWVSRCFFVFFFFRWKFTVSTDSCQRDWFMQNSHDVGL